MAEVDAGALAPVVPVIPAADAAPAPDSTADQVETPDGAEPEPTPEKTLTQSEVNKLVAKEKAKAERKVERAIRAEVENEYLKRQLEDNRTRQPQAATPGKPTPDQFAGKPYEEYVVAVAEWVADQKAEAKFKSLRQETDAQQQARATQERDAGLAKRLSEGAAKYPDFREVAGSEDVPVTHAMKAAIDKVKNPADVAYYLGSNIEEAQQIAASSDVEQVWAIKELSAKLSSAVPTKTPAPIVPNRGSSSGRKSMLDMSQDEFEKHRRARLARK